MPVTIDATVGGASANAYATESEVNAYFQARLALTPAWEEAEDPTAAIAMATRILDALAQPFKTFVPSSGYAPGYYRVRRQWTGKAATTTQRLAWPRIGMFDKNGNAIATTVIPQDLKDAMAELAGQLLAGDRTLDSDVIVQGISSLRAGPVSLSFRDGVIPQVIPDAVYNLLPQSWLTDELIVPAYPAVVQLL